MNLTIFSTGETVWFPATLPASELQPAQGPSRAGEGVATACTSLLFDSGALCCHRSQLANGKDTGIEFENFKDKLCSQIAGRLAV